MGVIGFESIETLDMALARLCQRASALRLSLGRGLEALARIDGHHDLGFPSLEAYALERCERATRWMQESRRLARNLENLPLMRRALISGGLGWSLALVIAKVATPEDEAAWLHEAETCTVREMTERIRAVRSARAAAEHPSRCGTPEGVEGWERAEMWVDPAAPHEPSEIHEERFRTLTVTVPREEAWLYECARTLVKHQGGATQDEVLDALLGEGTTALMERIPRDRIAHFEGEEDKAHSAQRAWVAQLDQWRDEAERQCEERIRARNQPPAESVAPDLDFDFGTLHDAVSIDHELRRIARELANRDLLIGQLAEAFWKADGWRRLRYATEKQYARERLRVCLSAIEAKRALARRVSALPQLGEALSERRIGYEAARLVAGVATPDTVDAWIARAEGRTVCHLREEVDAAGMLARLSNDSAPPPPSEADMKCVAEFESAVLSGAIFTDAHSTAPSNDAAPHMSACRRLEREAQALGRVTLKLRVRENTYAYYRWLEGLLVRDCTVKVTLLRFLCEAFIHSWKHSVDADVAYGDIYARDRYRCTNPVCARRDVTPHHLRFRSHGGDDRDENVTSLCVWCHLEGVHGGRLTATGSASSIEWTLGRVSHTVVRGRQRIHC